MSSPIGSVGGVVPEEIGDAIYHLVRVCMVAPKFNDAIIANRNIQNGITALDATILRYLSGAPFGTGSCPDGPNPSVSVHSDCDPSRGWRPIATAPKDGTDVLLYAAAWDWTWGVQMGRFEQGQWFTTEGSVDENEDGFDPEAETGEDFDPDEMKNIGPTHWAPIPRPPAQGIEARSDGTQSGPAEGESPVGHQSDAPSLVARLSAAETERDTLKAQIREQAMCQLASDTGWEIETDKLRAARDAALSRAERLEKALRPFASAAHPTQAWDEHGLRDLEPSERVNIRVELGEIQAAVAALASPDATE